jgi:hypothetical protein
MRRQRCNGAALVSGGELPVRREFLDVVALVLVAGGRLIAG